MSKFTKFHYDLKDLTDFFQRRIERAVALCNRYPDDPRYEQTMSEINIWQGILNFMTGAEETNLQPVDYDYMIQTYQEAKQIGKLGKFKHEPKVNEPIEVPQTEDIQLEFVSSAPETSGISPNVELLNDMVGEKEPQKKTKKKVKPV